MEASAAWQQLEAERQAWATLLPDDVNAMKRPFALMPQTHDGYAIWVSSSLRLTRRVVPPVRSRR